MFNISIKMISNFCGGFTLKGKKDKNPTATCQAPINQNLKKLWFSSGKSFSLGDR